MKTTNTMTPLPRYKVLPADQKMFIAAEIDGEWLVIHSDDDAEFLRSAQRHLVLNMHPVSPTPTLFNLGDTHGYTFGAGDRAEIESVPSGASRAQCPRIITPGHVCLEFVDPSTKLGYIC
jgi:hypothetical protein